MLRRAPLPRSESARRPCRKTLPADDPADALAEAFGGSSVGQVLAGQPPYRTGFAFPLNEEARPAAELFARLTGRRVAPRASLIGSARSDRVEKADLLQDVDVIVALARCLDDRLIERLQDLGGHSAVGILVGRDPAELQAKVVAAAVAARGEPTNTPRRIALQPDWPTGHVDAGLFQIFGAHSDKRDVRKSLGAGKTLVTLAGHGDGIDGELAGGLVLCPHDRDFVTRERERQPLCRLTGQCYRLKTRTQGAAFLAATLHPDEIVARALVWNSCVGWPAREGFIDREYGVGLRLAASPRIGALLTTDRVVIAPRGLTESLIAALLRGETLGRAVARHNRSAAARRHGHRLLLFGAPETRIAPLLPPPAVLPSPAEDDAPQGRRHGAIELSPKDRALRSVLAELLAGSPDEDTTGAWRCLLDLLKTKTLEGFWARTAYRIGPAEAPDRCPYCNLATTNHALATALPPPQRRIVRVCPRCEVISDTGSGENLEVRVDREKVEILGSPPKGPWRAAVILRTRWPLETTVHDWPLAADGRPEAAMRMAFHPRDVPVMASAIVYRRQSLSVFSRALPGCTDALEASR